MKRKEIVTVGMAVVLAAVALGACAPAVVGGAAYGGYKAGTDPRSTGELIDDGLITSRINAKLLAEPEVRTFNIDVDTREGEVTLGGYVATEDQSRRVEEIAAAERGVRKVVNNLRVRR
jgi:hyperosmotically inducible protein